MEVSRVEPRSMEVSRVEPRGMEVSRVEPRGIEPRGMEVSRVEPRGVEPRGMEVSRVEPRSMEVSRVEPRSMEVSREPRGMEVSRIEPRGVEPRSMEVSRVEPRGMEVSRVEPRGMEVSRVEPRSMEVSRVEARSMEVSRVEPRAMEVSRVEPRGVEPRLVVEPRVAEGRGMEPRGAEGRGVEVSRVEPRGVEGRVVEARGGGGEARGVEAPSVWQPVKLEKSSPLPVVTTTTTTTSVTTHTQPPPPQPPPVQIKPPPPPTPPPPSPPPDPLVSRLDVEEQRLRELREAGLEVEEAEEVLQEEAMARARALMLVCTKGPPAPLDTSHEKLSFLNTVGLITHAHAQEAELFQCERRARVLGALEPSTIPSSPKHTESISEELVPMLAPGHSLPPVITTPEELCLAHEYPHKARFLHHLGLQPQHSLHRQQEIEAVWQLVVQERLRRYRQESSDPLEVRVCEALEQLLTASNHHQQPSTTASIPSSTTTTTTSSLSVPLLKVTATTTTTTTTPASTAAAAAAVTSSSASQSSSLTNTTTATASSAMAVTTTSTATQATPPAAAASVVVTGTTATTTTTTATSTVTITTAAAMMTTSMAAPLVTTAPLKASGLPVTVASTGHNTPAPSLNSKVVMSRVGSRIPMKDAFIMSSLPPEEDPLLAGLQGVDTVIEHFIKNAQAQGGSNNSLLLEHIEEVRRSQLAVCQTAQLVQEQVAQLVASRAQLEAHRSALHHHLAAITSIIANSTANHAATTTSAATSTTTGNPPSTISNSTQVSMAVPVTTSLMGVTNGAYTLAGGNSTTSTATTATSTSLGHGHPIPLTTAASGLVTGHPITAVINRSIQSMAPNAPAMSWAGLAPPYLGSTNISLSMDNKDGVIYSHMTTKDTGKDAKTIVSSVNTSKPNRISLPHGNNKMPSNRHNSTKTHKHVSIETSHISPVKYNGIPTNPPKQIFKPLQISGPNANVTLSKKSKTMTYCPPPSVTGHPQPSVALVTPTTTITNQNGLLPLPVNHSSVSKNGRTNKPQIGFTPYSKTSPTKVTQSWISN